MEARAKRRLSVCSGSCSTTGAVVQDAIVVSRRVTDSSGQDSTIHDALMSAEFRGKGIFHDQYRLLEVVGEGSSSTVRNTSRANHFKQYRSRCTMWALQFSLYTREGRHARCTPPGDMADSIPRPSPAVAGCCCCAVSRIHTLPSEYVACHLI